jgi:uridine phosphorylase
VENAEGKQYHVNLKRGDVGKYVLLPGDPGRCEVIASYFDDAKYVTTHREYVTYTGTLDGVPVSVTSTGIGGPSAAIAMEELVRCGADTFLRVGTSGHIQKTFKSGDLAILTGAVRDEGTSKHYMPIEFPAVANIDMVQALIAAAEKTGATYQVGIAQSKDSFYGQHEPERMGVANQLLERWRAWEVGGVLCSEMEAAPLFVVASLLKVRAGGVMFVHSKEPLPTLDMLIKTSVQAIREVIANDKARGIKTTI